MSSIGTVICVHGICGGFFVIEIPADHIIATNIKFTNRFTIMGLWNTILVYNLQFNPENPTAL